MSCFPCFGQKNKKDDGDPGPPRRQPEITPAPDIPPPTQEKPVPEFKEPVEVDNLKRDNAQVKSFTFRELATATRNFRREFLVGEGGFGRVYKGKLAGGGQAVAVKQLDRNGIQESQFLSEVSDLSLLRHKNLVELVGYCADGEQRLLVYEFMNGGSLEGHLFGTEPLDWYTRMRIAFGIAEGLEYLHIKARPPVIYRDFKNSKVLLDEKLNPKLSDYGLSKLGPSGDNALQLSSIGNSGYFSPEFTRQGEVTVKSDVYSFGVILLELITGRRPIDTKRSSGEQNLVSWAQPIFREPKRFPDMADPILKRRFPEKDLNQVIAIAAMCLQEEPSVRPLISDVVSTLSFIEKEPIEAIPASVPPPPSSTEEKCTNEYENGGNHQKWDGDVSDSSGSSDSDYTESENSDHEDKKREKNRRGNTSYHPDKKESDSKSRDIDHAEDSSDNKNNQAEDEPHKGDSKQKHKVRKKARPRKARPEYGTGSEQGNPGHGRKPRGERNPTSTHKHRTKKNGAKSKENGESLSKTTSKRVPNKTAASPKGNGKGPIDGRKESKDEIIASPRGNPQDEGN